MRGGGRYSGGSGSEGKKRSGSRSGGGSGGGGKKRGSGSGGSGSKPNRALASYDVTHELDRVEMGSLSHEYHLQYTRLLDS